MAVIGYMEPRLVGGGLKEPKPFLGVPAQNAAWRRGSILAVTTTGSITLPPSAASGANLATAAAPAASAVTTGTSASAGAPAQTYYAVVTYTATGQETLPSQVFVINCPAGTLPTINVASAGAPAGATNFAAYMGTVLGYYSLQQATKTTTALGSTFTAANPLTNNQGWNQAATNASSGIVGIAQTASNETYFQGSGGSFNIGPGSLVGANTGIPPLAPLEAQAFYVTGLGYGQQLEMNLPQSLAFYPGLIGTTAGLTLDSTSGFHICDPSQSNKILTIVDFRQGVYIGQTQQGTVGDYGVRVVVEFNSGLALS